MKAGWNQTMISVDQVLLCDMAWCEFQFVITFINYNARPRTNSILMTSDMLTYLRNITKILLTTCWSEPFQHPNVFCWSRGAGHAGFLHFTAKLQQ